MAVNPRVLLAVNVDRDVPSPEVLNGLAVLLLGVVKLGELVALPVRSDVESREGFLAADQENTGDDAVIVLAIDGLSAKEVLARGLKTSMETTFEKVRHMTGVIEGEAFYIPIRLVAMKVSLSSLLYL